MLYYEMMKMDEYKFRDQEIYIYIHHTYADDFESSALKAQVLNDKHILTI
jgi:hypothetical protein